MKKLKYIRTIPSALSVFLSGVTLVALLAPSAQASQQARGTKFASTISDGTPIQIEASTSVEEPSPAEETSDAPKVSAPKIEPHDLRTAGEKIPAEKISEITDRIKYTYEIAKRFGIAYDYRAMTVKELKRVLSKLDEKN